MLHKNPVDVTAVIIEIYDIVSIQCFRYPVECAFSFYTGHITHMDSYLLNGPPSNGTGGGVEVDTLKMKHNSFHGDDSLQKIRKSNNCHICHCNRSMRECIIKLRGKCWTCGERGHRKENCRIAKMHYTEEKVNALLEDDISRNTIIAAVARDDDLKVRATFSARGTL